MSRGLSWALAALAGVALLAGCGESEKKKYTDEMTKIDNEFSRKESEVTRAGTPKSLPDAAAQFTRLRAVFTEATTRFQKVKPPDEVKDLHQRFVNLVRSFADGLTPAIQAAEAGDLKRFQSTAAGLGRFNQQVDALRRDYKAKGYNLK